MKGKRGVLLGACKGVDFDLPLLHLILALNLDLFLLGRVNIYGYLVNLFFFLAPQVKFLNAQIKFSAHPKPPSKKMFIISVATMVLDCPKFHVKVGFQFYVFV